MTVYNFNLGIGWASSGVEYAQAYRAKVLRKIAQPAKFVFTDLILSENIEHLTQNIGFKDDEVIWLYQFFTDIKISPTTYTRAQLEKSIRFKQRKGVVEAVGEKAIRYSFPAEHKFVTAFLKEKGGQVVERAEHVSHDYLIRKDYFTYTKLFSEYYTPRDKRAYVYQRRFFNEDGSIAYEQLVDGKDELYRFSDALLYSKTDLVRFFMQRLQLTCKDVIILDRATEIGQTIFRNHGRAKLGVVIHADHFSENASTDTNIFWNNYYEYQFDNAQAVSFFITATAAQNKLMKKQFKQYYNYVPKIASIPVGSLSKLRHPQTKRKPYSLLTASRLATEKHVDWLIYAVVAAHKIIPELNFDIYGKGSEEVKLKKLIIQQNATSYIRLKGHQDLTNIYQEYEAYLSASTSEGFGLTLLEAVGSGLPLIGLDVRYGNQTFIRNNKNGFLIPFTEDEKLALTIAHLTNKIVELFTKSELKNFQQASYQIGKLFLTSEVEKKWQDLLGELKND